MISPSSSGRVPSFSAHMPQVAGRQVDGARTIEELLRAVSRISWRSGRQGKDISGVIARYIGKSWHEVRSSQRTHALALSIRSLHYISFRHNVLRSLGGYIHCPWVPHRLARVVPRFASPLETPGGRAPNFVFLLEAHEHSPTAICEMETALGNCAGPVKVLWSLGRRINGLKAR